MLSNDGRSLLKRISVLALCAFISIAYMPGVAYALEGEEADSNGNQAEETLEVENADAGEAVTEETGGKDVSGEKAGNGDEPGIGEEDIDEEEPADEGEPVVGEEPANEEDPDEPTDGEDPEEEPDDGEEGSMSYTCAEPIVITEGDHEGDTDIDGDGNEYFSYYIYNNEVFRPGDVLTVNGVDYTMPHYDEDYDGDRYFEDSDGNTIYAYDLSVNTNQYENHWTVGNEDAKITIDYGYDTEDGWVSLSCDIPVTIVANPVQSISFEYAEPLNLVENTGGELYEDQIYNEENGKDETVYYYRYSLPYKGREGNKLTVNDTIYICDEDGIFISDDGKSIDAEDIQIEDDQSYENQWATDKPGHITVTYKGRSCVIDVEIQENPLASISFQFAEPLTFYEEAGGYWETYEVYDDEGEIESTVEYYRYDRPSKYDEGNKLTLHYKDGTEKVFTCNDDDEYTDGHGSSIDIEDLEIDDDQSYEHQWTTENPGHITITYRGRSCVLDVDIHENPVTEIGFELKKPITLIEGIDGEEEGEGYWDDDSGEYVYNNYFRYYCPSIYKTGNKLIVDGKEYIYKYDSGRRERVFKSADGDIIDDKYVNYSYEQSYEHPWTVENGGNITVTYMGRTCDVPVTIQANPVKTIKFEPAEIEVYKNASGRFCNDQIYNEQNDDYEDVQYFRYSVPSIFKHGNKLIINGTDEYTYNAEDEAFVNGSNKIDRDKIFVSEEEQSYENQWSETHPGKITIRYMQRTCDVPVNVVDNPVKNIDFVPAQDEVTVMEYTNGQMEREENEDGTLNYEYFYYYPPNIFTRGSKLIVDGVEYIYSYNNGEPAYVSENEDVIFIDDNDNYPCVDYDTDQGPRHPWTVKNSGTITVTYMGKTDEIPVTVVPNDIKTISYDPVSQLTVYENLDGNWEEDEDGNEYFEYNNPFRQRIGDKLYVNGTEYTYQKVFYEDEDEYWMYDYYYVSEDGRRIFCDEVDYTDDQSFANPWTKAHPGTVTIKYGGKTYDLTVNVISNPVDSIEFSSAKVPRIMEHTNGSVYDDYYGDTEYVFYRYYFPGFRPGDQLTVHYNDGRGTVKYTAQNTSNEDGDEFFAFISEDGQDIIEPYETIDYTSDQRTNCWEPGEHKFTIRYFEREADFNVVIYESDVESISFDPAKPVTVYEGFGEDDIDYDDEHFFRYDVYEYYHPGDKLTVNHKDGSKTVYTYTYTENSADRDYAFLDDEGNEIDDEPEIYNDQYEEHWHLGTDNVMRLHCFGVETEVPVTVKENPIASITTLMSHPVVATTENTCYRRDIYGHTYKYYYLDSENPSDGGTMLFVDGDKVVIDFKDNTQKIFTYDADKDWFYDEDGKYAGDLDYEDDQYKEHWVKDGTNPLYITYMGIRSNPINVHIDEAIDPTPINNASVEIEGSFTYTGEPQKPSVKVSFGEMILSEGRDYELGYENNVNAGTATVVLTGINRFTGTKRVEFTIAPKPVTPMVTLSQTEFEYNGQEQRPDTVNVTVDGNPAEADITWPATSVAGGTYTVTATLKGNYTGTGSATYTIIASPGVQAASEAAGQAEEAQEAADTAEQKATEAKVKAAKATKASSAAVTAAKASVTAAKDYLAKATAAKTAADAALKAAKATGDQALINAAQTAVSTAAADVQAAEAAVKAANTAYTKALDAQWKGVYYSKLSKVTILTPVSGKKYMTVKWKKLTTKQKKACSKIEVQYSLKKSFPRTKTVTKTVTKTKTSLKVKKLKSKKTYYVRVRIIKNVNGVKKVSKWSKVKKAKIK